MAVSNVQVDPLAGAVLSPTQQAACDQALALLKPGAVVTITQGPTNFDHGLGVTTLMQAMRAQTGGDYVDVAAVLDITRLRHPRHFEQSTYEAIRRAAERTDTLYLDRPPYGARSDYNRYGLIHTILDCVAEMAQARGLRVVFAGQGTSGAVNVRIPLFTPDDYRHLFAAFLGVEAASGIDFDQIHEHASYLNGHSIKRLCAMLRSLEIVAPTARDVIEASAQISGANIDLSEVEPLPFTALKGFEDILRRLDRSILMPIREPELARRLGLEPVRGVLLHGPPGTGKTSVGRALAHHMQGRFFMISGDYNHQMLSSFFDTTSVLFDMAARCTPSVIFIDDADVILNDPALQPWARFLLTKLDGLHSKSAGQVCVMMTAMNIDHLPRALLRSGRLEMFLETKLPDHATRKAILAGHIDKLPVADKMLDYDHAADMTDDFTPADLRSLVGDIASFIGLDRAKGRPAQAFADYFDRAARDKRAYRALAARSGGARAA